MFSSRMTGDGTALPTVRRESCGRESRIARARSTRRQRSIARKGAAALELAVLLPLLLLFVFACADFGRVIYAYLTVSNAARCGADYGAMHEYTAFNRASWESRIRSSIQDEMQQLAGFDAAKLQTTVSTTNDADGLFQVSVEVTYPFQTVVNWPGIPSQVSLDRKILMRQIR